MSTAENKKNNIIKLLKAAQNNNVEPFQSALNLGIDLDGIHDFEGMPRTPLMVACMHGSKDVIRLLLSTNKVFVDYKSPDGKTPLDFARERDDLPQDLINHILLAGRLWLIYNYKSTSCPNNACSSFSSCPYLHPDESIKRRHPRSVHYSPVLCKNFKSGSCREELKCTSAHGSKEINYHPDVFRTLRCFYGEGCARMDTCCYAHYGEEKLLKEKAAAVLLQPPLPRENAWFPTQQPPLPQDNAGVPTQQPPQLQDNAAVPAGVPTQQQPQPQDNAAVPAGVPTQQPPQSQDDAAVPTGVPTQQPQPQDSAAVPAGVPTQQPPQPQVNAAVPTQPPPLPKDNAVVPMQQPPQPPDNAAVPAGVPTQQPPQPPDNAAVPAGQPPQSQDDVAVPLQQSLPQVSFNPEELRTVLQQWGSYHEQLFEKYWRCNDESLLEDP